MLKMPNIGFSVHSRVRAKTQDEAERVGKYMVRPLLSLKRLSLDEKIGQVCYLFINHLNLTFMAERPPPRVTYQEVLMAAEAGVEYFS